MVMLALSVTVCEIITFNLPKWLDSNLLPSKSKSKVIRYNIAEYVVG